MAQKRVVKKRVAYCPPAPEVLSQYAREVCQELGQKLDASFNTPNMIRELAAFIGIVASIYADYMNKSLHRPRD